MSLSRRGLFRLVLAMVLGLGSIAAYMAVGTTVNAQPPTTPFHGWVAVLQSGMGRPGDQVELLVLPGLPGAPGAHPELGYEVAVCGDHPFDGVLLAGGDARLTNIRVIPSTISSAGGPPVSRSSSVEDLPDLTFSPGSVDLGPAQVLRLTFTDIPACTAPFSAEPPFPAFSGAVQLESGRAMAPVQRSSNVLWWNGPRSSQVWPLTGVLPGFPPSVAGLFFGGRSLPGQWSRPVPEYIQIAASGLAARASVDEVQPQPLSTTGLVWEGMPPLQPTARVTDVDAMSVWQQGLVIAGIALGIGGSLLASLLFELGRPPASGGSDIAAEQRYLPRIGRPVHRGSTMPRDALLVIVAAVLLFRLRRQLRDQ